MVLHFSKTSFIFLILHFFSWFQKMSIFLSVKIDMKEHANAGGVSVSSSYYRTYMNHHTSPPLPAPLFA